MYSDNVNVGILNKIALDEGFFDDEYPKTLYMVLGYNNFENDANINT